jgi:Zinc finger, C3HC4 type (RING finger)
MSFFPKGFLLPPAPDAVSSRSVSSDQSDRKLSATSSHEVNEKVSEHLCCGICLDLLVHPQTVAPCGHTYCAKCLAGVEKENDDKCPECRTVMVSVVPALQLKGVIEALVTTMPGMFAEGDVDHYHERLKTEQCGGFKVRILSFDGGVLDRTMF